jgi:bifunctional enzyme CysN/CysC
VDDGKSTLIGRLLYESDGIFDDQLASVRRASILKGQTLDLSLITDGLRAEREQSITIDVAYRYFSTPRRQFIIADAPGHAEYTRNMATCASKVDLAIILIDARKGVLEQTRQHTYIAWLLGVRRVVVAVNKMDLVGYDQSAFLSSCRPFAEYVARLGDLQVHFIPVSALNGDNVVRRSERTNWYRGPSLLEILEATPVEPHGNRADFRFPVQTAIRPHQDFRGYGGQVVSGVVRPGDDVIALPSGQRTQIKGISLYSRDLAKAFPPLSVVMTLSRDLDLGRGDMLANPERAPAATKRFNATLLWLSRSPLRVGSPYFLKHTTQMLCGSVARILYGIDVQSLQKKELSSLNQNGIAAVELETNKPMFCDTYSFNHVTGSFIVIDPLDNTTVAGGMITECCAPSGPRNATHRSDAQCTELTPVRRTGLAVWCTGLSGSGKTTICSLLETELLARGFRVEMLDGDVLRKELSRGLGFTKSDRDENIRRIGFVAKLLSRHGVIALVSAISPYREIREEMRRTIGDFLEVFVNAPLDICEQRDPKGLYKRVRAGELSGFTGIDDPYEPPLNPDVQCDTHLESVKVCVDKILERVLRICQAADLA